MNKLLYSLIIAGSLALVSASCNKYVDINHNPNSAVDVPFSKILPQAIVSFANAGVSRSVYGGESLGYIANAGGVSGWGTLVSYNYTSDYAGFFNAIYDNVTDLNLIIDAAKEDPSLINLAAAATVIKVYSFQNLVDIFNNVPYADANLGAKNYTPKYDKGSDIYKSLATLCDSAIGMFNLGEQTGAQTLNAQNDPLFKGSNAKWKQLANTLKLRLIIRSGNKVQFANKNFSSDGFLTEDAICNPGYSTSSAISPYWNQVYTASNSLQGGGFQQRVPTPYVLGFYNDDKISDPIRGVLTYKNFPDVAENQLGYLQDDADHSPNPNAWFIGKNATNFQGIGLFKGPTMGMPVMSATESYLLQAEGVLDGIINGDVKSLFKKGVSASFQYLEEGPDGALKQSFVNDAGETVKLSLDQDVEQYFALNIENPLVNLDLATSNAEKLEAIITQKYISFNSVFGLESWNEFRRTAYPKCAVNPQNNPVNSFVSLLSESNASNKLPSRIKYPQSEDTYNHANWLAVGGDKINVFTDKIFWAK